MAAMSPQPLRQRAWHRYGEEALAGDRASVDHWHTCGPGAWTPKLESAGRGPLRAWRAQRVSSRSIRKYRAGRSIFVASTKSRLLSVHSGSRERSAGPRSLAAKVAPRWRHVAPDCNGRAPGLRLERVFYVEWAADLQLALSKAGERAPAHRAVLLAPPACPSLRFTHKGWLPEAGARGCLALRRGL